MNLILKHRQFNLFWHRKDGWVHYDYAERFSADEVKSVWIPREHKIPSNSSTEVVDAGVWLPDDNFTEFAARMEDFAFALNQAIKDATLEMKRLADVAKRFLKK